MVSSGQINITVKAVGVLLTTLFGAYSQAETASTPQTLSADFNAAIAQLESDWGPYHSGLSEHLVSLGLNLKNNGHYQEAHEALDRAMHLSRINEGLYSLNQVPILEQLIETNVAAGNWQKASENHNYLFWLYRRNYEPNDPRMLPTLRKLSHWHLNAFSMGLGSGLFNHLVNAHSMFASSAAIIESNYGDSDLRLVDALQGLKVSNYYLATYQGANKEKPTFEASFGSQQAEREQQQRLEQFILRSYGNGRAAIARIIDVYENNPESPPYAVERSQVDLADWQLLFNRPQSAMALYQNVLFDLEAQEDTEEVIHELFAQPVQLPILETLSLEEEQADSNDQYVLVQFDVNRYGAVRNIEILESHPEDDIRNRSRVRSTLKSAKFRPRFENGEAAETRGLVRRYVFND